MLEKINFIFKLILFKILKTLAYSDGLYVYYWVQLASLRDYEGIIIVFLIPVQQGHNVLTF